jgi:hypothetical protein
MTTWSGWAEQLLAKLGFKDTSANLRFLHEWAAAAGAGCRNNPLGTRQTWAGSTVCDDFTTQNYTSHATGISATAKQLHESRYSAILAALKSGNPFAVGNWTKVADELDLWGATNYAPKYRGEVEATGQGGTVEAAKAHRGWGHLQRAFNHDLRPALLHSQRTRQAALRYLARARRLNP